MKHQHSFDRKNKGSTFTERLWVCHKNSLACILSPSKSSLVEWTSLGQVRTLSHTTTCAQELIPQHNSQFPDIFWARENAVISHLVAAFSPNLWKTKHWWSLSFLSRETYFIAYSTAWPSLLSLEKIIFLKLSTQDYLETTVTSLTSAYYLYYNVSLKDPVAIGITWKIIFKINILFFQHKMPLLCLFWVACFISLH